MSTIIDNNKNVGTFPTPPSVNAPPTFPTPPGVNWPPIGPPPQKRRRRTMSRRWRFIALIALIVLLIGGSVPFLVSWLGTVLPAATATMTITPSSQHLTKSYILSAVTGTPIASQQQIQARLLSFTTKAQSKTVKATGSAHQDATQAQGSVTVSANTGTVPVGYLSVPGNSGVSVTIDVTSPVSSGSQTFNASAVNAGSGGNIPAYDIDHLYQMVNDPGVTYYLQNTRAFTGGQDAHDYTFVQQSDIDGASTPLVDQLTSDAQSAVQNQLSANEQMFPSECTSNVKANHQANDRVANVTVTVTVTCKGEAYDAQAARSMAADLLKTDAASQLGTHYALVGDIVIGTPLALQANEPNTLTLNVSAEGMWVYQFNESQKQQLAQLIAGKPLADAQALLLKQEGISKVKLMPNGGWGSALPSAASDIKFTVVPVPGLHAQSTS